MTEWRLLTLVEGLLLGGELVVDDLRLTPLRSDADWFTPAPVLRSLTSELSWQPTPDMGPRGLPLLVARSEQVGQAREEAMNAHVDRLRSLLTALSFTRGGTPRLVASVAESRIEGTWRHAGLADHRRLYAGNLMTGFLAGEDPEHVSRVARAATAAGPVGLWLQLAREARNEPTSEGQTFRYVMVMEMVAPTRVAAIPLTEGGTPVTHRDGQEPKPDDLAPRLLSLLVDVTDRRTVHLPSLMPPGVADPWFGVRCLVAQRNAVAHYGGYRADDDAQRGKRWHQDLHEFLQITAQAEPLLDGRDHLARTARELVNLLIEDAIDGHVSTCSPTA